MGIFLLCGLVTNSRTNLLGNIRWNPGHVVGCAGVFCALLQNGLLSFTM
jgi:hypothetical protein